MPKYVGKQIGGFSLKWGSVDSLKTYKPISYHQIELGRSYSILSTQLAWFTSPVQLRHAALDAAIKHLR